MIVLTQAPIRLAWDIKGSKVTKRVCKEGYAGLYGAQNIKKSEALEMQVRNTARRV